MATLPPDLYKRLADIGISNVIQIAPTVVEAANYSKTGLLIYVYLAGNLAIDEDFSCIQRLRRAPDPNVAFAPMLLVAERLAPTALRAAINAGFDDILLQPVGAADLHTRIVAAITSPRVFYATSDYAGPDRRRGLVARSGGADRRAGAGSGASRLLIERSIAGGCRVRRTEQLGAPAGDKLAAG